MNRTLVLDKEIRSLAKLERKILAALLPKLNELERTKGYLQLQTASMFEYLTKKVGYSEGSAQRRLDAARLYAEVPEIQKKIEQGTITLNQITAIKSAIRQKKRKVSPEEKRELIEKLEGQNTRDSQQIVAKHFDLPALESMKFTKQADGSYRLEATISAELFAQIQEAQAIVSHEVPSNNFIDLLDHMTRKIAGKRATAKTKSTATMAVTPKLRAEVLAEEPRCQHVYPDGTKCGSTWQCQVDHKTAKWRGGTSDRANLNTLCGKHNREKFRLELH